MFANINLSKAATTVTFTALPGTSTAYLTQGSTGLVVFGFSMVVSGGSYSPIQFNIQTTTNVTPNTTNSVFTTGGPSATTSFLSQNTVNSPSTAATAGTHYAVQCNTNAISVTSGLPTYAAGTYYFYLVLAVAVNTNSGLATNVSFNISSTTSPTVAQTMTGVTSVTSLTSSPTFVTGKTYGWLGSTAAWGTASNWQDASGGRTHVPTSTDLAQIGVSFGYTAAPVVTANEAVGQIVIGNVTSGVVTPSITVTGAAVTLAVTEDITLQGDNFSSSFTTIPLTGTGNITAVNLNVISGNTENFHSYNASITSSVNTLTLSGNIALTSDYNTTFSQAYNSSFNLTAGTTSVAGLLETTNVTAGGCTSTFTIKPPTGGTANLQLANITALSGLSTTATNVIDFDHTGSTVSYNNASTTPNQVVYAAPTANVANTATPAYYNLTITTTGTVATTKIIGSVTGAVNTLTVDGLLNLTTLAPTNPIVTADFNTFDVKSVINNFTNGANVTLVQGGPDNFTVNGATATNAGTMNLTGSSSFVFNGTSGFTNNNTVNGNSGQTSQQNILVTAGTLTNAGTINWYGATGAGSAIEIENGNTFANTGNVNMNTGSFSGSIIGTGLISNTNAININNAGTFGTSGTLTNSSAGNIKQSLGVFTVVGLVTNSGAITKTGGAFTAGALTNVGTTGIITGNTGSGTSTTTVTGTFTNSGKLTCNAETVTFNGDYTALTGATFTAGTGMVYFGGGTQALSDNSTAGTTFNNVTFNGTGTATMGSGLGNFAVSTTGTLTMVTPEKLVAGPTGISNTAGYLTLNSNATGTASIDKIISPSTSTISGNVNVQRYITGSTSSYRGYRLFGSPTNVNASVAFATTQMYMGLYYIGNPPAGAPTGALTGGPTGGGFTYSMTNPSLYLYDETRASSATSYVSGRNVGVAAITGSTAYTISYFTTTGATVAGYKIPAGSAYLMYFIGNTTHTTVTNLVPENTTTTDVGYLNQGDIPVYFGSFGATSSISTTIPHTNNGYNQVGNPYASTISLDQVATDNSSVNSIFYELSQPGGTYVAYHSDHTTSDARASKYIVSGQGFIIKYATGGTGIFTFHEDQKVAYPTGMTTTTGSTTTGTFLLDQPYNSSATVVPDAQTVPKTATTLAVQDTPVISGLHLQLTKDTANFTQTGIYFAPGRTDAFKDGEDAIDLDGTAPVVYLSSYSTDGTRLSINELSPYTKGKRVKLYARATSSGLYHISLNDIQSMDTVNYNVFLVDNNQKDSLDMVRYKTYAFNINTADTTTFGANRFVLAIEPRPMARYQLVTFTGQKASEGVLLNWVTYNEGDFTGFVLQKLVGGKYVSLDSLQSTDVSKYSYTDINPITGSNTYRLQQSDFYGNITYSAPVTIIYGITPGSGDFLIYPNPSRAMITINTGTLTPANTTPNYVYSIYNTSGLLVGQKTANSVTWTEDLSNYKAGMYIIVLKDNNGKLIGKSKFIKTN